MLLHPRRIAPLLALAWLAPIASLAQTPAAVPLPPPLADVPDSGPAVPSAIPLVTPPPEPPDAGWHPHRPDAGLIADAGAPAAPLPPPAVEVDAGPPAPVDAGAPAPGVVADAGAPAPVADGGAPEADGGAPQVAEKHTDQNPDFVKGELSTFLGSDRLVTKNNRVGVSIGYNYIDRIHYALVDPQVDLRFFGLSLGLAVPLNIEILDTHFKPNTDPPQPVLFDNAGRIRKEDWQDRSSWARVLNYLTYGHKEDHIFVNVGQRYADTLGHGELMRRYAPNIDINTTRVSAEVDAYNDYAGFETLTNDIMRWNIVGALAFVKPAAFFSENDILRSLSIGASWMADFQAPTGLQVKSLPGSGLNDCDCRPIEDENGNVQVGHRTVQLASVDAEIKVLRTRNVDIKPYLSYGKLLTGDGGATLGTLGRFNFGSDTVHAVRLVAEGRYLGSRYKPAYFDTFYEVDKLIFNPGPLQTTDPNTGAPVVTQPTLRTQYDQVVSGETPNRFGYYLEASYGVRGYLGATISLEGNSADNKKNLVAHLELPDLFIVQVFGTVYKRGITSFNNIASLDSSTIAVAGARIKVLPILFVNLRAYQSFLFDADDKHNYVSSRGVSGDLEVGWEF